MHNAVNRLTSSGRLLGPEQRISAYDALKAYTSDAAYCSFEENIKGTITPGKLADFVVLAQNPLEVEKEKIKEIQILSTIMGGEVVFSQGI
jgi:predicted amidohydrolase YtcJ